MSSPEQFNKWQQSQTDVAQLDFEYAWYTYINTIGDNLKSIINDIDTLEGLNKAEIDNLIQRLIDAQTSGYTQAKTLLMLLLGYFADYISVTEAKGLGVEPKTGLITAIAALPIAASGMVLSEHIDNLVNYANKKLDNHVRFAWANKHTQQELKERVLGTKKVKYKDGLLHDQKVKSRAMIDTAMQQVYNGSKAETWKENGSYKYRLLAVRDGSTTDYCRSVDGLMFEYGSSNALIPPFHYYCRTVMIPELADGFDFLRKGRTVSSFYGETSANWTFNEWIKENPIPDSWEAPVRPKRRRNKAVKVEELN